MTDMSAFADLWVAPQEIGTTSFLAVRTGEESDRTKSSRRPAASPAPTRPVTYRSFQLPF